MRKITYGGYMESELRAKLLATAEKCTRMTKLSEPAIGLKAIKDNTVLRRIREGSGFTIRTYDRLMEFMEIQMYGAEK